MRSVMLACGLMLVASPAFAQKASQMMPAPRPAVIQHGVGAAQGKADPAKPSPAKDQAPDPHFNQQVSVAQQRLQQEEQRLQSQFAQIEKLRSVALDKQDLKELDRINRLEQQVVAEYQKRVEQVLINAQSQIQTQPVQPQPAQVQPTQTQRGNTRPTAASKPQEKQQDGKSTQSTTQRKSSGFWLFGRG